MDVFALKAATSRPRSTTYPCSTQHYISICHHPYTYYDFFCVAAVKSRTMYSNPSIRPRLLYPSNNLPPIFNSF